MSTTSLCLVQETFVEQESLFPNCYPTLIVTYKSGYLYVSENKLFEYQYKSGGWDEPKLLHDGPVSCVSAADNLIFIIVAKRLLQRADNETDFTPVPNAPCKVVQVSSGRQHALLLTEDGEVFARGSGPQCGLGNYAVGIKNFTKIPDLSDIFHISAGDAHSAALQYSKERNAPVEDSIIRPTRSISTGDRKTCSSVGPHGSILGECGNPNTAFIRDFVNIGRVDEDIEDSNLKSLTPVPVDDPFEDIKTFCKMESQVWIWGHGESHQLGLSSTENKAQPVQLSNLLDVVEVFCGPEHTVALTAAGQLFIWGKYLKDRVEKVPVEVNPGPDAGTYVITAAVGKNFTTAYGQNADVPTVFVIDKNKRLQQRSWITKRRGYEPREIQYILCDRDNSQGHVVVVSPVHPNARGALFKLNYRILVMSGHFHKLRRAFVTHFCVSDEEVEKMTNLVQTFMNFLDCITKFLDVCCKLTQHLTRVTLRQASLQTDTELPKLLQNFANVNCCYCSLFADLSSLDGLSMLAQSKSFRESMRQVAGIMHRMNAKQSKKLTQDDIIKILNESFEKGVIVNYDELTDWSLLEICGSYRLRQAIQEMKLRGDENIAAISEAATSAGIVKTNLKDVQEKFFVRDRRIKLISTEAKIDIFIKGETVAQRDAVLVLSNNELIYVVDGKMKVFNYQCVWVVNHNAASNTVDVLCPELSLTLKGSKSALEQWMTAILEGVSRKFDSKLDVSTNGFLPTRQFEFTFENDDRYSGNWKNAKMHGQGTLKHRKRTFGGEDPYTYTGEFRNGKKSGYGRMVIKRPGNVIEEQVGSWLDDRLEGYVEVQRNHLPDPDSSPMPLTKFKGYYSRGKPNGLGRLEECEPGLPTVVYLGNFVDKKREGFGISYEGDMCYFGDFSEDLKVNKGFTINYLMGEIVETQEKDTRVKVISGPNYTYTASTGPDENQGIGTLCYKLDNHVITFCGRISRENDDDSESWKISEGKLTIKRNQEELAGVVYLTDIDNNVSPKWRSLVNDCGLMMVPEPYRKDKNGVERLWREHLPKKLGHFLGDRFDKSDFTTFVELASKSSVTAAEFERMRHFCSLVIEHCPHFPLTFFLELRRDVFSYFVGVHQSEHLEPKVLNEFKALYKDTYCLLRLLFPALPVDESHFVDEELLLTGRDLVLGILSDDFYRMLTTIFNSITAESSRDFRDNTNKWKDYHTFLEQSGHFANVRDVAKQIREDVEKFPNGSENPEKLETIIDLANLIHTTFSNIVSISASKAFELLNILHKAYQAIEGFLSQSDEKQGADEVLPATIFVLWYANPTNIGLCLSLIRHLTMHRVGDVGDRSYALNNFHAAFFILVGKS